MKPKNRQNYRFFLVGAIGFDLTGLILNKLNVDLGPVVLKVQINRYPVDKSH